MTPDDKVLYVLADENGEITSFGCVQPIDVPEGAIFGAGTRRTHYVADGALIAYTEGQVAAKASPPSTRHVWSNGTMTWVDTRSLDDLKAEKWSEIKQARETAEFAPFVVGDRMFDGDPQSQARIQGAVQLAQMAIVRGSTFEIEWTLADNSVVTLNAEQMITVGLALAAQVQAAHAAARTRRAAVFEAADTAAVESISWP